MATTNNEGGGGAIELQNLEGRDEPAEEQVIAVPDSKEKKPNQRIVWVKKNLIDQTAALSYCLGVSIVHLSMFLTLFMVEMPDLRKVTGFSVECQAEAEQWYYLMKFCNTTHIVQLVANSYREIFNAQTDMFGQFMRLVEVACIPVYLYQILSAIELLSVAIIRLETAHPFNPYILGRAKQVGEIEYAKRCTKEEFQAFSGSAMEWLIIEVLVFGFFLITMLFTMCKSRFISVGMDNSDQFEDAQMSFMVNKIIKNINLNDHAEPEAYYVNKERILMFQGVVLKICLPLDYYNDIKGRKEVKPNNAQRWIKNCIVGNIRKFELDNERMKETNALDMMQNSSIIYHTESILEMQVCCLVAMILTTVYWSDKLNYADNESLGQSMMLMYVLMAEHVLSYLFGLFREYDIKNNGQKNKYGIESAQSESLLRIFEIIVDLGISAWILVVMLGQDKASFNKLPFLNFWIMCDMIIMVITLPYTYISKFMMINGEITKNIFTLYQV